MSTATINASTLTIPSSAINALRHHWPEYLMEGFGLGLFMLAACAVSVVLDHPSSAVHRAIQSATLRRVLFGAAMGATAILNIYSPWGKRSGAHLNPSTTLTFWRLGKVEPWDAAFYSVCQFAGGIVGVLTAQILFGSLIEHPERQLCRDLTGARRRGGCLRCRSRNHFHINFGGIASIEQRKSDAIYRVVRRCAGYDLHKHRGAAVRDEYEPGAHSWLCCPRRYMDRALDLLHRAADRNASGGGGLSAAEGRPPCVLRQAAPPQRQTLHLSMQLRRVTH